MASEKSSRIALCALALIHAAVTFIFALTRLYSYKASLLDIGLFDQLLWNLLHHFSPVTTATLPFTQQHWLGFHFSPLLFALAPLYALWPCPETLQVVQSLCFGFAALPLFFAARALGARPAEAWGCAVLYWINPLVLSAAVWDFHEIALSTLLIAFALYALCAQRFSAMIIALALLLLTKEHYGISVAGFGFLWGWRYGDWKRGGAVMATGIAAALVIIAIIMPYFHGGTHAMLSNSDNVVSRYGWLSLPWKQKTGTFLLLLFGDGTPQMTGMLHVLILLFSGLMLPLLAPLYLAPAAADILANLLSSNSMPRHIDSYHAAACVPVMIIAGLKGYVWLQIKFPALRRPISATALAMILFFPASGISWSCMSLWELTPSLVAPDRASIAEIKSILGDAPVSAQANIGMFFSERNAIYPFPNMLEKTNFAVLQLYQPFSDPNQPRFNIPYGVDADAYVETLLHFMSRDDWHIRYWHAPWLVMERGKPLADETLERAQIQQAILAMGAINRPAPQNP